MDRFSSIHRRIPFHSNEFGKVFHNTLLKTDYNFLKNHAKLHYYPSLWLISNDKKIIVNISKCLRFDLRIT